MTLKKKRPSKIPGPSTVIAHSELGKRVRTVKTPKRKWYKKYTRTF